jgi:uncharacterized membrane protein
VSAEGFVLALVFALCGAGALLGIFVPERRNPALLAWAGSLASLLAVLLSCARNLKQPIGLDAPR